jgi:hypothetical protein
MSTALAAAAPTLDKLIRRLGSSHDGERLATEHAIERVLKTAGRDWHDLADAVAPPLVPKELTPNWRQLLHFCADHARLLNNRERSFISTLKGYHSEPSEKQLNWLRSIAVRLAREAA